ncbi:hypothetical protein THTE_0497 [Thermogutta terrifontis]|uniref:Uncharacterized protein n=1 Tax=Thermogutta terrifontis TaxID=1331910 RepID=A0A286RAY9_9BACT|nr:hypothetical protein THTE_0497 [Thermogutta terrifontis]
MAGSRQGAVLNRQGTQRCSHDANLLCLMKEGAHPMPEHPCGTCSIT